MQVAIKKFQSLDSVVVDLRGFTVLTGQTNLGKSAFIRAMAAALFGLPGDHFIRHGSAQYGVGINDDGKYKIKYYKTAAGKATTNRATTLEIDGKLHTKIGKEHGILTEPLGFRILETSGPRLRPQVALQHDSIFLLGENPTIVAEALKMLGRADVVTEAQRCAKRDTKEADLRKKVREEDVKLANSVLEELEKVGEWRSKLTELQKFCGGVDRVIQSSKTKVAGLVRLQGLVPVSIPAAPEKPVLPGAVAVLGKVGLYRSLGASQVPVSPVLSKELPHLKVLASGEELGEVRQQLQELAGERDLVKGEIEGTLHRRGELEKILGVCPTCGRKFDAEHAH